MYLFASDYMKQLPDDPFADFIGGLDIKLTGFGRWRQGRVDAIHNFVISEYQFAYTTKGASRVKIDEVESDTPAGTLVLYEPFVACSALCMPGEQVEYYYINFDVEPVHLQADFKRVVFGGHNVFTADHIPDFTEMLACVKTAMDQSPSGAQVLLRGALYRIFVACMRAYGESNPLHKSRDMRGHDRELDTVSRCVHRIREQVGRPIKVSDLSKAIGVSENYLYRAFMKVMRVSPSQYIQRYKATQARAMLKMGSASVAEIAEALGYSSPYHFSSAFKHVFGIAPSTYRKQTQQEAGRLLSVRGQSE